MLAKARKVPQQMPPITVFREYAFSFSVLSILESKWGYLFCIVIVSLLLFLQEVFDLIIEIKYGSKTAKTGKSANKGAKVATAAKAPAKKNATTKTAATTVAKKVANVAQVNNDVQTGEKEG